MVKHLSEITVKYFTVPDDATIYGYVEFYYDVVDADGNLQTKDNYRIQKSTDYSIYEERIRTFCDAVMPTLTEHSNETTETPA